MRDIPAVHGRAEEIALLQEYLKRAIAGEQQLVLLEGDPGIGKTSLLQAFARAQPRGRRGRSPRFLYLRAPEKGRYAPVRHAAMAATNRRRYAMLGADQQATELAKGLVTDWLQAIPVWGNLLSAIAATVNVVRRRGQRVVSATTTAEADIHALVEVARRRPLVLLLDELESADAEAVEWLTRLIVLADAGAPILIVAAYRPTAPGIPDPAVHALRRRLPSRGERFAHRRLTGLEPADVAAWLRARFPGAEPTDDFIDRLHSATGGHPGAIVAALDSLVAKGSIYRDSGGWRFAAELHATEVPKAGLSLTDLAAINPQLAETVTAATLLGEEFHALALARLLDRDELLVEDHLALGVHYEILESTGEKTLPNGELTNGFRFATTHLHAALRQNLVAEQRGELEDRLARLPILRAPRQ